MRKKHINKHLIPSIRLASTASLFIISASPRVFAMIRTGTAADASATMISFPPTVSVTIIFIPASTAASLPVIPVPVPVPVPVFIPIPEHIFC